MLEIGKAYLVTYTGDTDRPDKVWKYFPVRRSDEGRFNCIAWTKDRGWRWSNYVDETLDESTDQYYKWQWEETDFTDEDKVEVIKKLLEDVNDEDEA